MRLHDREMQSKDQFKHSYYNLFSFLRLTIFGNVLKKKVGIQHKKFTTIHIYVMKVIDLHIIIYSFCCAIEVHNKTTQWNIHIITYSLSTSHNFNVILMWGWEILWKNQFRHTHIITYSLSLHHTIGVSRHNERVNLSTHYNLLSFSKSHNFSFISLPN